MGGSHRSGMPSTGSLCRQPAHTRGAPPSPRSWCRQGVGLGILGDGIPPSQRGNALHRRTYVGRYALRGLCTIPIAVAVVLAAAGCGGGNGNGPNGTPLTAVSGPGGAGAQSVTDYVKYTGGKAGKADQSLPPVYVGWINQQG